MNKTSNKLLKLNINEYEIFENGNLIKTVSGGDELEKEMNKRKDELHKAGYSLLRESTAGYAIYVKFSTQSCVFIAYRNWRGFVDSKGSKIYRGDVLVDYAGNCVGIYGNPYEDSTFYYRTFGPGDLQWHDYPIENTDFIKVAGIVVKKSVFETFDY